MRVIGLAVAAALTALMGCGTPHVADDDCTMTSAGHGECSFTNRGTATGGVCGRMILRTKADGAVVTSFLLCSGMVEKQSTAKVEFFIAATHVACGDPWRANCDVDYVPNLSGPSKGVREVKPPPAPFPTYIPLVPPRVHVVR